MLGALAVLSGAAARHGASAAWWAGGDGRAPTALLGDLPPLLNGLAAVSGSLAVVIGAP